MKSLGLFVKLGLAFGGLAVGCDSNPTPHPQNDVTVDTRVDTMEPTAEGPDDDRDGVPDCEQAGGFWTGDSCRNDVGTPDASSDTMAPDVGDVVDGDVASEIADAEDDGQDAGQGDAGPDTAD